MHNESGSLKLGPASPDLKHGEECLNGVLRILWLLFFYIQSGQVAYDSKTATSQGCVSQYVDYWAP